MSEDLDRVIATVYVGFFTLNYYLSSNLSRTYLLWSLNWLGLSLAEHGKTGWAIVLCVFSLYLCLTSYGCYAISFVLAKRFLL